MRVMRSQCKFNEYFFKIQMKKQRMSNCSTPIPPASFLLCNSHHPDMRLSLPLFLVFNNFLHQ